MNMLSTLESAFARLPDWLDHPAGWCSLDVDYHPPRVERLFRAFGAGRLYLHRVHPCDDDNPLFHPHPWPCAIRVLKGRYAMQTGYGTGDRPPPRSVSLRAEAPFVYAMEDRNAWHAVRAVEAPVLSVMVTGAPWDRWSPRPDRDLRTLTPEATDGLLAVFRAALHEKGRDQRSVSGRDS